MFGRLVGISLTVVAVALAASASAQMGGMGGGMMQGSGGMGDMMGQSGERMRGEHMDMAHPHERPQVTIMLHHRQELNLTADQVRKLQELRTEFAKESERRTAEIRIAEIDLDSLLEQDRWDLAKVEGTVKQIGTLQSNLRMARLKTIDAGRALLTPDQLQKLKQVGHRMAPGGGGGMMQRGMGMHGTGQQGPATSQQGTQGGGGHQH